MIRVGLAHCSPSYRGLRRPGDPARRYPELDAAARRARCRGPLQPRLRRRTRRASCLGLDADAIRGPDWNPIGALVARGKRVVLKPNLIRHWNPAFDGRGGTVDSVITHGSVIRAVADYALLAAGPTGSVALAEAPQMDCDFEEIRRIIGLDEIVGFYDRDAGSRLRSDRPAQGGGRVRRRNHRPAPAAAGGPAGLPRRRPRRAQLLHRLRPRSGALPRRRLRSRAHGRAPQGGRNAYLLSETVLAADLVVNLPKLKTHKKTGVTLALKNLVGINGDKNWLPHHSVGAVADGGDEFPGAG
jgi:hypothetical protein